MYSKNTKILYFVVLKSVAFFNFTGGLGASSTWTRQVKFLSFSYWASSSSGFYCCIKILIQNSKCSGENGEKEDIYQLGIILLEVITGKLVKSPAELNEMKLGVSAFAHHNTKFFLKNFLSLQQ